VVWGVCANQGQLCNAGSRLLVDERVHDELLERVVAIAATIHPDDPLDDATQLGALADQTQLQRVLGYIDAGRREGGVVRSGGHQVRQQTGGFFVEPTVFADIDNGMTIAREEIFGPVLSTIPFSGADEAIRIANDTPYGLAAAVWTADINVARELSGSTASAGGTWRRPSGGSRSPALDGTSRCVRCTSTQT
jgi:acyl-CoA reductase-like NAD-dependent aldehyde dehydrogenase